MAILQGGPLSRRIVTMSILLSLTSVALAGCVDPDDVDAEDDTLSAPAVAKTSATTGAIKGTVASDLFEPIAGIDVLIVETGDTATSNRLGEFVFNEMEPGRYTVAINEPKYRVQSRSADVAAGEVTKVQFRLELAPSNDPWVELLGPWVGKITVAWSYQLEAPVIGCQVVDNDVRSIKTCSGTRIGDDNGEVEIPVTDDAKTLLVEMVWDPAGPLGEFLAMDFLCTEVPRDPSSGAVLDTEHDCYFEAEQTTSPIVHRVDESHWLEHGYNYTGEWAARVFSTYGMLGTYDATGIDAGVAYEQTFTIYGAVFHKEAAPEGFSGIPDS